MKKGVIIWIVFGIFVIVSLSYFVLFQNSSPPEKTSNNTENLNGRDMLQIACKNAVEDYPDWTKTKTDIIIWEDSDKDFNFRNSPEDSTTGTSSPALDSETLWDMDFVDYNEISYLKNEGDEWKIGLFKLRGLDTPINTIVYETADKLDYADISPINKKQFAFFSIKGDISYLNILDTEELSNENLLETSSINTNNKKISVSPKGTYVYIFYGDVLRIFEIIPKTKIKEINSAESAVWVGDSYLLYSASDGLFIYDLKNNNEDKLEGISSVSDLSFNPDDEGIIAYNSDSKGEIVNCQTWASLNSLNNGNIETLASEKTAIIEKEGNKMYWRFKDADWTLAPSQTEIINYVTVWKRY